MTLLLRVKSPIDVSAKPTWVRSGRYRPRSSVYRPPKAPKPHNPVDVSQKPGIWHEPGLLRRSRTRSVLLVRIPRAILRWRQNPTGILLLARDCELYPVTTAPWLFASIGFLLLEQPGLRPPYHGCIFGSLSPVH